MKPHQSYIILLFLGKYNIMTSSTFHFNVSNTALFGCYWHLKSAPKAVIILVHGMGEHIRRYERSAIPHLLKNGYAGCGLRPIWTR